ncbi:MAG: EscU/YscU/HrcU family type III secretion system export apparatus switch protein [Micavibrio sp.]|nr:EscU/YscU/HrcU family type III secretion system export apparatus switch protein [Micavibrio sp.]
MSDGYEDGYKKGGNPPLSPLNIKKKPKRQTAVALQEAEKLGDAPLITAAGRGLIAEQIMQLAFENGIKVREDSALAEMLAMIDLDSPIPSEAFMAVAEILSYVYRANGKPNPYDVKLTGNKEE